jgi:hypothetical protein
MKKMFLTARSWYRWKRASLLARLIVWAHGAIGPRNCYAAGLLGYGTDVIAGQQVPVRTWDAFMPRAYGPMTQSVPGVTPVVPPVLAGSPGMAYGQQAQIALAQPFDFKKSPLLFSVIALVLGLLILRIVHWRG